jgi:GNAT superfamily N-acetyltransferase
MAVELRLRGPVDDAELSALHATAFGVDPVVEPWSVRLERHSLLWVTAADDGRLVGFANVIGDGGAHAVLLDVVVDPARQGSGIGTRLVEAAADAARDAGCEWLHVDFEAELAEFYLGACRFRPTAAGLRRLT